MATSYLNAAMIYGSRGAARSLSLARTGRVGIILDADSKWSVTESGPWEVAMNNLAVARRWGGLHSSGWVGAGGSGSIAWPLRATATGGGALTSDAAYTGLTAVEKAALHAATPASWISPNAYVAPDTTSAGIYVQIHGTTEGLHASFGQMSPDDLWNRTETAGLVAGDAGTYIDVWCLKHNGTNFVDEITIRVTPTDTVHANTGVSAVQTLTSGGGNNGEPAAFALTGAAITAGTVVRRRFGPLTWKTSSTTRKTCQVNINAGSGVAGKKAIVLGFEFVNTNQATGVNFFPIAKASWALGGSGDVISGGDIVANGQHSHYLQHGNAGAVYQAIRDRMLADGLQVRYGTAAGVNDCYVYSRTAAQMKQNWIDRITQVRGWIGNVPADIFVPMYRDSNTGSVDSMDAEYDQYAGAAQEAADTLGNCVVHNLRLATHRLGHSRACQNIGVPPSISNYDAAHAYVAASAEWAYAPGIAGIVKNVITNATNKDPRTDGSSQYYWKASRNILPQNDNVHLAGSGAAIIAPAWTGVIDEAVQYGLELRKKVIVKRG